MKITPPALADNHNQRTDDLESVGDFTAAQPRRLQVAKEALSILLFLTAVLAFAFYPVVFGGKTTLYSAIGTASVMPYGAYGNQSKTSVDSMRSTDSGAPAWAAEPWMKLTQEELYGEHVVPLWNPYSGCGAPFLANMQSQVFTPINVILSSFASPWAYDLFVLSRLLVGGLLAYCAARLWVKPACAAVTGLIFMLCGYHLGLCNMSEISVSMMLPGVFAATELVIRRRSFGAAALCAGSVAMVLLGGMPELAFVVLLFTSVYAAFRTLTLDSNKEKLQVLSILAVAYIAGIALSAPQVLPFIEYMRLSQNFHDPAQAPMMSGLVYEGDWQRGLLTYLLPGALKITNHNVNFWGVTVTLLCMLAACSALVATKRGTKEERTVAGITLFFFITAVLLICKRFGLPPINFFGALPVANMVLFPKYGEPIIGFALAMLSAMALHNVAKGTIGKSTVLACAGALAAIVGGLLVAYRLVPHVATMDGRAFVNGNVIVAAVAWVVITAALLVSRSRLAVLPIVPYLVAALFIGEISYGYLSRAHFAGTSFGARTADPYAGAPYIEFLQKATAANHERIFATDYLLMPDWSAAYKLADTRALDAIYPDRYFGFINNFFPGAKEAGELFDRFYGSESSVMREFRLPSERQALFYRMCALTSTSLVAATAPLPQQTNLVNAFALTNSPNGQSYPKEIQHGGKTVNVLFQRAEPSSAASLVKITCLVPPQWPYLRLEMLPNPDVSGGYRPGEGAFFDVAVQAANTGLERIMHEQVRTSKADSTDTRLRVLDLKKFAGKQIQLRLSTATVSKEKGAACYMAWSQLAWCGSNGKVPVTEIKPGTEKLVYEGSDAKVYKIAPVLPRAALFTNVMRAANEEEALSALKDTNFNPFTSAIVEKGDVKSLAAQLPNQPQTCQSANIIRYASNRVTIRCHPTQPALLLLNDMYVPGWTASVDGQPTQILRANYCFRGLLLQPGDHTVEFNYDPLSFRLGLWLAAITAGLMVIVGLVSLRKKPG